MFTYDISLVLVLSFSYLSIYFSRSGTYWRMGSSYNDANWIKTWWSLSLFLSLRILVCVCLLHPTINSHVLPDQVNLSSLLLGSHAQSQTISRILDFVHSWNLCLAYEGSNFAWNKCNGMAITSVSRGDSPSYPSHISSLKKMRQIGLQGWIECSYSTISSYLDDLR